MSNFGITRLIDVTLTRVQGAAGILSFDIPALITTETPNASFGVSNRAKRYAVSELATVAADFGLTSEVYKAAAAIAGQSPTTGTFYIIKRDAAVATAKTITWSGDFATGETITAVVNGDAISVSWSVDQSTTQGLLNTAIAAAYGVNTSTGAANVNTVTADAEFPLDITISAAGGNAPTAVIATTIPGRTIADDLTAAEAEAATALWYAVYNVQTNAGQHLSALAWAQARTKIYMGQTSEAAVLTSATTDVISRASDAGYDRGTLWYRSVTTDHMPAALLGRVLSAPRGRITFANKNLAGVAADSLSASQLSFLDGKNGNAYQRIGNRGISTKGVALDGNPTEVWVDLDYLVNELNEAFLNLLVANDKIPFTGQGLKLAEATGQATINRMVTDGILDAGDGVTVQPPVFTVPALADITSGDKTARLLTGCRVYGTYAGSIIKVAVNATINLV